MRTWLVVLLVGCAPVDEAPECAGGLDENDDGVCDHDVADWSADATVPAGTTRANVFNLADDDWARVRDEGLMEAMVWPVDVSGVLLPYNAMARLLDPDSTEPATVAMVATARNLLGWGSLPEMYDWVGLPPLPGPDATGIFRVPLPEGMAEGDAMGAGIVDTEFGPGLTFSCAACHASRFFGHTVVGLTNRRARANVFFHQGQDLFPGITDEFFQAAADADEGEMALFRRAKANLPAIGARDPQVIGLDTSLAQVALSLSRRNDDDYATRSPELEAEPRPNELDTLVVDSKPAVWWSVKYKTRWLSDGSVVAGNPIFTNFLWNEIGRGTDLHELETWLQDNQRMVDALTAAVFATPAPTWTDFFPADALDIEAAKRGEVTFNELCASCHGTYEKGWSADNAAELDAVALVATTRVVYHEQTPVYDVGTDGQRALGMRAFADGLNGLAISAWTGTQIELQDGYVPPPLEAIFSRYPYLHNNAVPSLCELLTPAAERAPEFWMGPTEDAATDFDPDCVGYPMGDATPESWKTDEARFDTTQPGLRNTGHDAWLVDGAGQPVMDEAGRHDLIAYLKTL